MGIEKGPKEKKKHKDWFDRDLALELSQRIQTVYPEFDTEAFVLDIENALGDLAIKARLAVFATGFKRHLPPDYPKSLEILTSILGPENPEETGMFTNFYWIMPIASFVELYGLDHYDASIYAIAEITKRNTSEYAIRPFIRAYPEKTLRQLVSWSQDENFHLRRLASEGSRPRLPWAKKLDLFIDSPNLAIPILENLKDDPIKFVQKSVANHLNDIFKDNYDIAMELTQNWLVEASVPRRWILKHALRKLVKDGDEQAIRIRTSL